jgi:hypothetical protein
MTKYAEMLFYCVFIIAIFVGLFVNSFSTILFGIGGIMMMLAFVNDNSPLS